MLLLVVIHVKQLKKDMKVWVDIENTPHVPFFKPIIEELKKSGYDVFITARSYGGVEQLLLDTGLDFVLVGGDYGKNIIKKIFGVLVRIVKLFFLVRNQNIAVSVSHGSRAHIGAAWLARIPSLTSYDYEHSSKFLIHSLATKVIVPDCIPDKYFIEKGISLKGIVKYHGFKEHVYLEQFIPHEDNIPKEININSEKVIVLVRPPATRSHYFNEKSRELFGSLIKLLSEQQNLFVMFSPRDKIQREQLRQSISNLPNHMLLEKEYDGLSLIWSSDLVISGGGTMNREAALLGIPVYSIFGGKTGFVDTALEKQKRIIMIHSIQDLKLIRFEKKNTLSSKLTISTVKKEFVDTLLSLIEEND